MPMAPSLAQNRQDPFLIDSHCHLLDEPLYSKLPEVMQAAFVSAVRQFIVPSSRLADFEHLQRLREQYGSVVIPAFGIHPWYADPSIGEQAFEQLANCLTRHPQALVGEIGLDFRHQRLTPEQQAWQQHAFSVQLHLAHRFKRPVILHHRASLASMLASVKQAGFQYGGFVHAYSGSIEEARPWLDLGFKLGLGSVLLKANARKIYQLLPKLKPEDFVLETDAPYMVSSDLNQPYNEPKFVRLIAERLAEFYQCSWQEIAAISSKNVAQILAITAQERPTP